MNCDISPLVMHHMSYCVTETHVIAKQTAAIVPVLQRETWGSEKASALSQNHARSDQNPMPCCTHPVCSPKAHSRKGRLQGGSHEQTPHSPQGAGGLWKRGTQDGKSPGSKKGLSLRDLN